MATIETRIDVDDLFGLSRPTVQGQAVKGIQADLKILNIQKTGQQLSPFTAEEFSHLESVVTSYTDQHPLGFLAKTSPIIAHAMETEALRRDITTRLGAYNFASGNFEMAGEQIDALRHSTTDTIVESVPQVFNTIHRDLMVSTLKSMRKMADMTNDSLWGTSTHDEREMRDQFRRAAGTLANAIRDMDNGDTQAATTKLASVLGDSSGYIQWFNRAFEDSERSKFAARIGITMAAALAAAYTGGASLALLGGAEAGWAANTTSLLISGFTMTSAERGLNVAVFNQPFFAPGTTIDKAADFAGDGLKNAALFGWMNGMGIVGKTLPIMEGEPLLAGAINGVKDFAFEFGSLTAFNMVASTANLIDPEHHAPLEQVVSRQELLNSAAFLVGVKGGNKLLGASVQGVKATAPKIRVIAEQVASGLSKLGKLIPEPAAGFPMLMAMPKWAFTLQESADNAANQATAGGKNVLSKVAATLGDLYFGKGQLPTAKKIPQFVISGLNLSASFALANLVRHTIETSSSALHNAAPFLFNEAAKISPFFSSSEWAKTWHGGAWSLALFLGLGLVIPRIANGSSPLKSMAVDAKIHPAKIFGLYAWEGITRGILGIVRLMGDRDVVDIQKLEDAKTKMKTAPITTWMSQHISSKQNLAFASALAALPDWILGFAANALPTRKAKLAGVGVDVAVNAGLRSWNIYSMKGFVEATDIASTMLITGLMAIANTHITQHQGFNPTQVLTHRSFLGFLSAGPNTGFGATGVASHFSKYSAQFLYGLFSIWYAAKMANHNPAIGEITEVKSSSDTRATLDMIGRHLAALQVSGRPATIVVMDSGLGGLSVAHELNKALQGGAFPDVRIVYYNAIPSWDRGFNVMIGTQRAAVLDVILAKIDSSLRPDLVIMPDHTLAVTYPGTEHAVRSPNTILGPISPSVDLITAGLKQYPNAKVVIMGGQVVIESDVYQKLLELKGIPSSRILTEICPGLSKAIETDFDSPTTQQLIMDHASSIRQQVKDVTAPVFVSLNNTQLAFVADRIQAALEQQGLTNVRVIDPSRQMTKNLLAKLPSLSGGKKPNVRMEVVSQVPLDASLNGGLGGRLDAWYPSIGDAVRKYHQDPLSLSLPEFVDEKHKN